MSPSDGRPQPLRVAGWETIPNLAHGFFGRQGGVSHGPFAELNLSFRVGDAPDSVRENWRRVRDTTSPAVRFVTMQQVHGAHVVTVDNQHSDPVEGDALVTRRPGMGLSILTADCVPILMIAPRVHAVAAVHAGWRGTVQGIAPRAVQHLMHAFGIESAAIHAALGPAIGGCCYEVSESIVDDLEGRWGRLSDAISGRRGGKARLDLRRANAALLTACGVPHRNITTLGPCTQCAAAEYFSYRASRGQTGRQLSFIGWRGA